MVIKNIVIAGAGIMGSSIAQIFAKHGYNVSLYDIEDKFLERSKDLIKLNQKTLVEKGELSAEESEQIMGRLSHTLDKSCFAETDFVIEAIIENMDAKHKFWSEVSQMVRDDVLLTSNTSGLSITEIAKAVRLPERFCGMHWVNPPHLVPLVEVICGEKTAKETAEQVYELAKKIDKKPILVKKDAPGFVLNRIQFTVLREAMHIVESDIASIEDVDNVLKYGLGMRYACLGPFEIADLGGLDTFYNISSYLFKDLSTEQEVPKMLADLIEKGAYGVKTEKGFYDYSNGRAAEVIARRDAMFIELNKCLFGKEVDHAK